MGPTLLIPILPIPCARRRYPARALPSTLMTTGLMTRIGTLDLKVSRPKAIRALMVRMPPNRSDRFRLITVNPHIQKLGTEIFIIATPEPAPQKMVAIAHRIRAVPDHLARPDRILVARRLRTNQHPAIQPAVIQPAVIQPAVIQPVVIQPVVMQMPSTPPLPIPIPTIRNPITATPFPGDGLCKTPDLTIEPLTIARPTGALPPPANLNTRPRPAIATGHAVEVIGKCRIALALHANTVIKTSRVTKMLVLTKAANTQVANTELTNIKAASTKAANTEVAAIAMAQSAADTRRSIANRTLANLDRTTPHSPDGRTTQINRRCLADHATRTTTTPATITTIKIVASSSMRVITAASPTAPATRASRKITPLGWSDRPRDDHRRTEFARASASRTWMIRTRLCARGLPIGGRRCVAHICPPIRSR